MRDDYGLVMEGKRVFTRQELYELVWSTPISKLAYQFGLSDRGLSKTCERHHIPVPGRGYWARLEAGQKPTKTPLWKLDNPDIQTVYVGEFKRSISTYVAEVIQTAQLAVVEREREAAVIPSNPPIETRKLTEPAPRRRIDLPEYDKPHPSIRIIASELRSAKPDEIGQISTSGIVINQLSRHRITNFLNHMADSLERFGILLTKGEMLLEASLGDDSVSLTFSEGKGKEKHVPTEAELAKKLKHDRRQAGRFEFFPEKFWPEYDYFSTGVVTLEVHSWAEGARKRWSDGKNQNLEGMLASITDGIHFHLSYKRADREKREEDNRVRAYMGKRRELHKKREEREQRRLKFLESLARYHEEADALRRTLANIQLESADVPGEYERMIDWARNRLAQITAENEVPVIVSRLQKSNLFPSADELYDPEGDPPPKADYWDP